MEESEEIFLSDPDGVVSIYESEDLMLQELGEDVRELGSEAILDLSSAKPSNGVEQLRSNSSTSSSLPTFSSFWQSDDMIPHSLTFNFSTRRSLKCLAIFLDYQSDESYTPRLVEILVGNNSYSLLSLFKVTLHKPQGWVCFDLGKAAGLSGNGWILLENSDEVERELGEDEEDEDESEEEEEEEELGKVKISGKNLFVNKQSSFKNKEEEEEEEETTETNQINQNKVKKKQFDLSSGFSLFTSSKTQYIRAHCVQFRILSMHDNGKDTHVRQARIYGKKSYTKLMGGFAYKDFKSVEMSQFCMLR